jgi:hypothetical protein
MTGRQVSRTARGGAQISQFCAHHSAMHLGSDLRQIGGSASVHP